MDLLTPTGLWNVMTRVPVVCSQFFTSIDWFSWSKISFEFFVKDFFCWLLTCVYWIYWIIINLYWNLSLGVSTNFLWDVSKSDIQLYTLNDTPKGSIQALLWLKHIGQKNCLNAVQEGGGGLEYRTLLVWVFALGYKTFISRWCPLYPRVG